MANPLYVAFDLPTPRGPTAMSVRRPGGNTFPNFMIDADPVEAARDFMDRLFYPRLSDRTIVQIKFTMAFICVLEVIVTAILVGRLYDRSFWVFRFARKANGTLIIPNALIDFSLFAGIFGYFLIAMNFLVLDWFHHRTREPTDWPLWMGTTWIFVAVAAHMAGMGTHFARPQSTSDAKAPGRFSRTIGRPLFVNLFTLFAPIFWATAIVSVAAVSNSKWHSVLHDFTAWQHRYADAQALTRDMLLEAIWLWGRLVNVYVLLGVCYLIWTIWAFQLFVQYCIAAGRLLYIIGKQIRRFRKQEASAKSRQTMRMKSKAEAGPLRLKTFKSATARASRTEAAPSTPATEKPAQSNRAVTGDAESAFTDKDEASSRGHHSEVAPPTPGSSKALLCPPGQEALPEHKAKAANKPVFADDSADEASDDDESDGSGDDELDEDEQRARQLFTNAEIAADDPTATFFPPVKPSRIIAHKQLVQASKQPRAKSFSNKSAHLVSIYRHVMLQFVAIGPAIIILVGWTSWNAFGLPSCAERNTLPEVVGHGLLWVDWVCCIAGSITLIGIAQRTYEPMFSMNLMTTQASSEEGSKRRKKKKRVKAGDASTAQNVTTWFESQTLNPNGAASLAASSLPTTTAETHLTTGISTTGVSTTGRGLLSAAAPLPTIRQSEDGDPTTSAASMQGLRALSLGSVEKLPPTITRPRGNKTSPSAPAIPRLGSFGSNGIFSGTMSSQPVDVGHGTTGIFMQRTVETAYEVPDPHLTNPLPGGMAMPDIIASNYGHERVRSEDSLASPAGSTVNHLQFFSATAKKAVAGPLAGKGVVAPLNSLPPTAKKLADSETSSDATRQRDDDDDDNSSSSSSDGGQDDYGEPEKAVSHSARPPVAYIPSPSPIVF